MNTHTQHPADHTPLRSLKTTTSIVYLCQVLTFALAGLPLLVGVAINLAKRSEVAGSWLESHFNWQIKTAWLTLAGFAVSGLAYAVGLWIFPLSITLLFLVYRIAIGWTALTADKPVGDVS